MNIILLTVSLLVLIFFVSSRYIKYLRFKHTTNMCRAYDRMEMHFSEKNIVVNDDYVEFLKIFKNLCVNPDYLDIQVLVPTKIASEKTGNLEKESKWFFNTLESLGDDFKELFIEFDNHSSKVVKLSFFRIDFILFLSRLLLTLLIFSGFRSLFKIKESFDYAQENEEIITYSGMNLKC